MGENLRETSGGSGRHLGREDLKEGAFLRYRKGLSWEEIVDVLRTTDTTLRKHRKKPLWDEVTEEVLAETRKEAVPTSYGALEREARKGDVAACKALLDRIEGAVPQKLQHGQDEDAGPLRTLVELHGLDKLQEVARDGNGTTDGGDG